MYEGGRLPRYLSLVLIGLLGAVLASLPACGSGEQGTAPQHSATVIATPAGAADQLDVSLTDAQRDRATDILSQQVAFNRQTYAALQQAGLTADTLVTLDFTYVAPDRKAASALGSFLENNDCLNVKVAASSNGHFEVTGHSQPTTITADLLDKWVTWMVVQGVARECEFDGWGTLVPR